MNAIEWARKNVYLWKQSPIHGQFDETKYPLVIKQLESLDDYSIKSSVHYGPTQSIKTVLLMIFVAYQLDVRRRTVLAVAQTDDTTAEFSKVKLQPFLETIKPLTCTLKKCKYPMTLNGWFWPAHELLISGPGAAKDSKSASLIVTDEAHLWNIEHPGALTAIEDRSGMEWNRRASHFTTAADEGTEIDIRRRKGRMLEWSVRCPDCSRLFAPLWEDYSKERYGGHRVFTADGPIESAPLDSIRMVCPWCQKRELQDEPRLRAEMDTNGDYVALNPDGGGSVESFEWNAFALRWKPWRDLLAKYQEAIASAKLGNLEPYEVWIKKYEVRTWRGDFPMLGTSATGRDYRRSDLVARPESIRVCTFDVQEGRPGEGGFHLWGQVDEFDAGGASRRVDYQKLASWEDARAFQITHGVPDKYTACDFGARTREVFGRCRDYRWTALKSGDYEDFEHPIADAKTGEISYIKKPYSTTRLEDPMAGKEGTKLVRFRKGTVPPGFCISRLWSKPQMYGILYALKSGTAGRYYGIATDLNPEYENQLHSYVPMEDVDSKTKTVRKIVYRKTKTDDHSFITSCQSLVIAIQAGFYPLDMRKEVAA